MLRTTIAAALAIVAGTGARASADPKLARAASACVNRNNDVTWRVVRDTKLDARALTFCTGDDCWALDLATNAIKSIPTTPPAKSRVDGVGELTADDGTIRATATPTQVSFCPTGPTSCKQFTYKLPTEPTNGLHPLMNAAGTLGVLLYRGLTEEGEPTYVLTFDLAKAKQLKQLKASNATPLRSTFLIDGTYYTPAHKKLGKLAVAGADGSMVEVPGTDLVVLENQAKGELVIQNATTAKVAGKVALGVADHDVWFSVLPSADGKRLYAIANTSDEGEVLTIDVATRKVTARAAPPICAAGTQRPN